MEIRSGAQTRFQIGYHIVWGVKYHKHLLNKTRQEFLLTTVKEICINYDYYFYSLGLGTNHVHLFVGAPPKVAPAKVAQVIKSISARQLFLAFPEIKKKLWGGNMWKDGYYVGTIGEGQTEAIILRYLEHQDDLTIDPKSYVKQLKMHI
jgi:putative transposase